MKILEQVNVLWLIPGVICVVVFIWGESIIIYYMMRTLKIRLKKWTCFLLSLIHILVPFIAFIILKKKVGMKGIIGAIMSVIGVALLSLNGNLTLSLGDGLTLLCAVGFAFQIFFTGEFVKKYPASVLNMVQMITAFVLSAVSLVIFGENDFQVTTQGWLSVLYLGVISTTVCYQMCIRDRGMPGYIY